MTTISGYLTGDHKRCDEFFIDAETAVVRMQWERASASFMQFYQALEQHFTMEEEVLFPAFEKATGNSVGPTAVMRCEHGQMRELVQQMAVALDEGNMDDYLGHSDTLNIMMQQHNLKEESVLYQMTDRVLAGRKDEVMHAMQDISAATQLH